MSKSHHGNQGHLRYGHSGETSQILKKQNKKDWNTSQFVKPRCDMAKYLDIKSKLPKCCVGCRNLTFLENKWYDAAGYQCARGLFMPTKKQTCKLNPKIEP